MRVDDGWAWCRRAERGLLFLSEAGDAKELILGNLYVLRAWEQHHSFKVRVGETVVYLLSCEQLSQFDDQHLKQLFFFLKIAPMNFLVYS